MKKKKNYSNIFVGLTILSALGTLWLIIKSVFALISLISGVIFYLTSPNATALDFNGIGFIAVLAIILVLLSVCGIFLTLYFRKHIK
jgi:hypothetical protein